MSRKKPNPLTLKDKKEIKKRICEYPGCNNKASLIFGGRFLCANHKEKSKSLKQSDKKNQSHRKTKKYDHRKKRLKQDSEIIRTLNEILKEFEKEDLISMDYLMSRFKKKKSLENPDYLKILLLLRECSFNDKQLRVIPVTGKGKEQLNNLYHESEFYKNGNTE